jgi:hypothetical protein
MYRGYNLRIDNNDEFEHWHSKGMKLRDEQQALRSKSIKEYVKDKRVDASQLQKDWFGDVNSNVFISHSHQDIELITGFAGYLHDELGLTPFVDSFVWGYIDELLREVDDQYCRNKNDTHYLYELRNRSTSHIHLMLASALNKMINVCECIFFVNTDASVTANEVIDAASDFTASPWIYSEIETTKIIQKIVPDRRLGKRQLTATNESFDSIDNGPRIPQFNYELDLTHLWELDLDQFTEWRDSTVPKGGVSNLDALYELTK